MRDAVLTRGIIHVFLHFSSIGRSELNRTNLEGSKPILARLNFIDDFVRDAGLSRGLG